MFTPRVMTNSTRPAAISVLTLSPLASGKFRAISAAMVWLPVWIRLAVRAPEDSTSATAMVSPRARPSPSITALMIPGRPNGSTVIRIISQRVAPSASAASSCSLGVCRKISRLREVMIGRTMTASTIPAVRMVLPVAEAGPWKIGSQPMFSASQLYAGEISLARNATPQAP